MAGRQGSPCTGKLSARPAGRPGCLLVQESLRRSLLRHCSAVAAKNHIRRPARVFQGMAESIAPMGSNQTLGRDRAASRRSAPSPGRRTCREGHALPIVGDEFRPAIPRSGCSPAEPVSASPARPDYHAHFSRPAKTGHFYFAENRTFLLCVDSPHLRRPSKELLPQSLCRLPSTPVGGPVWLWPQAGKTSGGGEHRRQAPDAACTACPYSAAAQGTRYEPRPSGRGPRHVANREWQRAGGPGIALRLLHKYGTNRIHFHLAQGRPKMRGTRRARVEPVLPQVCAAASANIQISNTERTGRGRAASLR